MAGLGARILSGGEVTSSLILFLIVFPLSNALFDWLSFGATRYLLWKATPRIGARDDRWRAVKVLGYAIADLALTSMFLVGLGIFIVSFIWTLNEIAPGNTDAPFIDLQDKFNALRSPEDRPEWLYVMHFSTFLPSFVHLTIALFALPVSLYPARLSSNLAAKITPELDQNTSLKKRIALWQSIRWVGSGSLIIIFFWWLFTAGATADNLSLVGRGFLWPVENYAKLIGAI
ncbi:hypothetical protein [Parvularcula marina]|uniref:hypothetical protein n=1 Tax=Parvularcula marina TaxID=2292771 RepID=UPI0035169942